MKSSKRPVRPVHRGRWAWAPAIVVAATVTGAVIGPLAPAASKDAGSGVFACPPGLTPGQHWGDDLFT
jgi:hypothetical protein